MGLLYSSLKAWAWAQALDFEPDSQSYEAQALPGWAQAPGFEPSRNALDVLRELPEITRAEEEARAELAWELIYKQRATLKGNYPPKPGLGPLTLPFLDSPSLPPPCHTSPALNITTFRTPRS